MKCFYSINNVWKVTIGQDWFLKITSMVIRDFHRIDLSCSGWVGSGIRGGGLQMAHHKFQITLF